jgi:3-oxoacyl-[acyl-carrier-protein] synthase-3
LNLKFKNKKISGICIILPKKSETFEENIDNYNFSIKQSFKLKRVMGYGTHRIAADSCCVSDLSKYGLEYLIKKDYIKKKEIDALVLVTQSPDYFMPPTSSVIQGLLNLKEDMICYDINQGCAGYIFGLIQSFMLLEQEEINKVVLINADVLSRKTSRKDRSIYPLIGDAASITIIENDKENNSEIFANIKMDGTKSNALMIPAGGFRLKSSPETAILEKDINGHFRAKDHYVMKGDIVFNFVQTAIPPLIDDLINFSDIKKEDIDYYFFHQANKFILQKLSDKLKVSENKMPHNVVENFGNSSGASIPTAIAFNLDKKILTNKYKVCLCGYGVGLTWASMLLDMGKLNICEMIDYKNEIE